MVKPSDLSDVAAEESLIGACLLSSKALYDCLEYVVPSDFLVPDHQHIWTALAAIAEGNGSADPVTVASRLEGLVTFQRILEIQATTPAISMAKRYAEIVVDFAGRRRLVMASSEIAKLAQTNSVGDALDAAATLIGQINVPTIIGDPSPDLDTFTSGDASYDWLVPGLLERGDRLLITGGEGAGKSTLLRQIGLQLAAGVHPFRLTPIEPLNVLHIDFENGQRLLSRKLDDIRRQANVSIAPGRYRIESKPEGIDITTRSAQFWLSERVRANSADVVCVGPVYKMAPDDDDRKDAANAQRIQKVLDSVRALGVTLIMETHAPHGDATHNRNMRPIGSSKWLRWPEFGYGLTRDYDSGQKGRYLWKPFRGDRDGDRDWPVALLDSRYSRYGRSSWPWMAEFASAARDVAS